MVLRVNRETLASLSKFKQNSSRTPGDAALIVLS